jgi:hypothetical protein
VSTERQAIGGLTMDETSVRAQLREVQNALKINEQEREVLMSWLAGLEGWLRLTGRTAPVSGKAANGPMTKGILPKESDGDNQDRPPISYRKAVLAVLQESPGQPIHTAELVKRVKEKGAVSNAKDVKGITDLNILNLMKKHPEIKKVAPRTWQWVPEESRPRLVEVQGGGS